MGFGVPVGRWMAGEYADWMRGILLDPGARSRTLLNQGELEEIIIEHGLVDHGDRLWALVCLELWMRAFGLTG